MDNSYTPIFFINGVECGIHAASNLSSISEIQKAIFSELGLHPTEYYLKGNGKIINNSADFSTSPHVHVCLRLLGGKGGFGSMLRAIGAQIEKTTNRDACRDLSGRRLRDINEEQRLKRWFAKQGEREQEKEELRKKKLERLRKLQEGPELPQMNDPEYFRQRAEIEDAVYEAVDAGFGTAKASTSAAAAAGSDKHEVKDDDVSNTSSSNSSAADSDVKSPINESKSSVGPGPSKRVSDAPTNAQPKKKLKKLMLDEDLESGSSDESSDEDDTKK